MGRYGNPVRIDYRVFGRRTESSILTLAASNPTQAHIQANELFRRWFDIGEPQGIEQNVTIYDDRKPVYKEEDLARLGDFSILLPVSDPPIVRKKRYLQLDRLTVRRLTHTHASNGSPSAISPAVTLGLPGGFPRMLPRPPVRRATGSGSRRCGRGFCKALVDHRSIRLAPQMGSELRFDHAVDIVSTFDRL